MAGYSGVRPVRVTRNARAGLVADGFQRVGGAEGGLHQEALLAGDKGCWPSMVKRIWPEATYQKTRSSDQNWVLVFSPGAIWM